MEILKYAIFVKIISNKEPYRFVRFSKTVVLSRYLSDFFKRIINLILVGTWNDIIEFSVDLRTAFKEFSSDRVTLSARIGFFNENYLI